MDKERRKSGLQKEETSNERSEYKKKKTKIQEKNMENERN